MSDERCGEQTNREDGTKTESQARDDKNTKRNTAIGNGGEDGPPDDKKGFFGHPLTAATSAIDGDDSQALRVALLHEYMNFYKGGAKEGDRFNTLYDITREEKRDSEDGLLTGNDTEDILLIHYDVEKFLNEDTSDHCDPASKTDADDGESPCRQNGDGESRPAAQLDAATEKRLKDALEFTIRSANGGGSGGVTSASSQREELLKASREGLGNNYDANELAEKDVALGNGAACFESEQTTGGLENRKLSGGASQPAESRLLDRSKTIYKALTAKILRKRMSENGISGGQQGSVNGEEQQQRRQQQQRVQTYMADSLDLTNKLQNFSVKQEGFLDDLHGELPSSFGGSGSGSGGPGRLTVLNPAQPDGESPTMINNAQGQFLQVLQPVQPVASPSLQPNSAYAADSSVYYNPYPMAPRSPLKTQGCDRDRSDLFMIERYIHQQHYCADQVYHQQPYGGFRENYSLKSPDSGFHEPSVSPTDNSSTVFKDTNSTYSGDSSPGSQGKCLKRRRSQNPVGYKQLSATEKFHGSCTSIVKLDPDTSAYKYVLETPTSTTQRIDEDRITYLNKGQYYGLSLEFLAKERFPKVPTVRSVIMILFRDEKSIEDELKAWEFWHGRQHSIKQRILDIDTKNSHGVLTNCIEEISHNAVSVRWNPRESPARVNVALNCLSTDFSNQKGVKGIPLHIQIDTYEGYKDSSPVHRAYCQIKVFCDKGAERKTRDEERRRAAKAKADSSQQSSGQHSEFQNSRCPDNYQSEDSSDFNRRKQLDPEGRKRVEEVYHPVCEKSEFYAMADRTNTPILFNPLGDIDDYKLGPSNYGVNDDESSSLPGTGELLEKSNDACFPTQRKQRKNSYSLYCMSYQKVLLYVRERHESVFTALLLRTPTLDGLLRAIEEKYEIPASKVKSTYKRSKKGILVKMDNNIIQHYSHESTFIIEKCRTGDDRDYEIILTEIES